jgi:hypothetical protein
VDDLRVAGPLDPAQVAPGNEIGRMFRMILFTLIWAALAGAILRRGKLVWRQR